MVVASSRGAYLSLIGLQASHLGQLDVRLMVGDQLVRDEKIGGDRKTHVSASFTNRPLHTNRSHRKRVVMFASAAE